MYAVDYFASDHIDHSLLIYLVDIYECPSSVVRPQFVLHFSFNKSEAILIKH